MAIDALMIGMMNCTIGGIAAGSVRSASITVKPQYKEHRTGYPSISDLKSLIVAEGVCRVDSEENTMASLVKSIAYGLSAGIPQEVPFNGKVPGLGGTACAIDGVGFGSSSGLFGKSADFGYCTTESTCIALNFVGSSVNSATGVPFVTPVQASQALTLNRDNLLFGSPVVGDKLCQQAQFICSSKVRYIMTSMSNTALDAAIMESTDFTITASFMSGNDAVGIKDSMVPGNVPDPTNVTMSVPTVSGGEAAITMKGILEADISFNPGNDWNGIGVKYTAMLTDPTQIGTNWAGIA